MLNIVLISHLPSTKEFYKTLFSRTPNVKCMIVPFTPPKESLEYKPVKAIYSVLSAEKLKGEDIDIVMVSSNYGQPASYDINDKLLDSLLTLFPRACVIAVGNTPASLIKAVEHKPFVKIMGQAIKDIQNELVAKQFTQEEIKKRVLSIKNLKDLIEEKVEKKELPSVDVVSKEPDKHLLDQAKDENLFFSVHKRNHRSDKPNNPFRIIMLPSTYDVVGGKFVLKSDNPDKPIYYLQSMNGNHYTLIKERNNQTIIPEGTYSFVLFTDPLDLRIAHLDQYNLDGKAFDSITGFGEITFKKLDQYAMITSITNKSSSLTTMELKGGDDLVTKFKNLSFRQSLAALKMPIEKYTSFSEQKTPPTIKRCNSF